MKRFVKVILILCFLFFSTNVFAKSCSLDTDCPASEYCDVNNGSCTTDLADNNICNKNSICKSNNCVDGICRPAGFISNGKTFGGVSKDELYDTSNCDNKCPTSYKCKSVGYVSDASATNKVQYQCVEGDSSNGTSKITCLKMYFGLPVSGMQQGDCVDFDTGASNLIQSSIKFIFASIGTIAVIVFIIAGFMLAFAAGNQETIKKARGMIKNVSIGLIIAIFSGSILAIINPDLVNVNTFNVKMPNSIEVLEKDDVEKLLNKTGLPEGFADSDMTSLIYKVASANNIDYCILYTFAYKESNGIPYAIGHDEKVYGTKSYSAFCSTRQYYTGSTFNSSDTSNCNSSKNVTNNDSVDYDDKNNLGLDWRYSHGIGMMQITIFPNSSTSFVKIGDKNPASPYYITIGGKKYYAKDLLDPETSLIAAINLLKDKGYYLSGRASMTDSDMLTMFQRYNGSGDLAKQYATDASKIYKNCLKNFNSR